MHYAFVFLYTCKDSRDGYAYPQDCFACPQDCCPFGFAQGKACDIFGETSSPEAKLSKR